MATIVYKSFKGEIPRMEPYLLPHDNAQLAKDCDFDSGALAPIAAAVELLTVNSNPAKGFYTEDGINFFSWPVETIAFNSPIASDAFNRIYYLQPSVGTLFVANRVEMGPAGPVPTTFFRAGLPDPTVKPYLAIRERTTLPDYPSISITAEVWWEDITTRAVVNKTTSTVTTLTSLRYFQLSLPSNSGAPAVKRLGSKLIFTDTVNAREIFNLQTYSGGTSKSEAVPGTVEGLLQDNTSFGYWTLTWGVQETRSYTYTYENTWNEESAAAPPATISVTYVQDVDLTTTAGTFTGYRPFLRYNLYRTYGNVPTYFKTAAIADGSDPQRFYDSSTKAVNIGAALESAEYIPLGTGMAGIEVMPNGWAVAFKGNTLYMSEPYRMHAWPYSTVFKDAIRGVKASSQALVVTTAGGAYLILGAVPAAKQQVSLSFPQPGLSHRSMVEIDGAVAYLTNDGIAMITGASGTMEISQKLFTRKSWRAGYGNILTDASVKLAYHDGMLVAQSTVTAKGFVTRLDEDVGSFTRNANRYDHMQRLPVNDALYFSVANKIYSFRGGTDVVAYDWWGKDHLFERPRTFGCGWIRCEGTVTMQLYADGQLVATETLVDGYFRLADMDSALRWSVRFQASVKIYEFALARNMRELQSVL